VLLNNIRRVHAAGDAARVLLPDEGIVAYLRDCNERMGAAYFQTPRDTVKDFVNLLNILEQDRSVDWRSLLQKKIFVSSPVPTPPESSPSSGHDDLTEFKL